MANLIPEKRVDRNGTLVTKHVRATAKQAPKRSNLPAPSTGTQAATKAAQKAFKPRPRQVEQSHRSYRTYSFPADPPLVTLEERDRTMYNGSYLGFEATDVEIYDVLSATTSAGNALAIMARGGVRNAKDARAYLKKHKASELIADRSDLTTAALERGINADVFVSCYEILDESQRKSPYVLDAVEFKNSPLNYGMNSFVLDNIVDGEIAFSDLKAIGLSRLKPFDRANALTEVLTKLNRGEADYSIDDVKAFVIRAAEAKTDGDSFKRAANFAARRGFDLLQDKADFELMSRESYHFLHTTSSFRRSHMNEDITYTYDRIEYGVRMSKLTERWNYSGSSTAFFEAGVPAEVAAEVINNGGGVREAMAIHQDSIQSSVSGGWL